MSHTPKILIVDDEPRLCDSLKTLLSYHGYEAHTSTRGREALRSLVENGFDLVLLDIVMPDIDGYQVMDYIDRHSLETPVISMTGHASIESAVAAFRGGADDYLRKPLDYEELLKTVRNVLDQKKGNDEHKQVSERLLKAEVETKAASRAKRKLMPSMCHEMRIPVNGVIGMTKLLLDTELTSEQRECAEMLHATGESLREIIDGDSDFSQVERDTFGLGIIDFDLQATMEALSDSLAERVLTKGLQFACLLHPEVPGRLRGDPRKLRQILLNLSDNALKFTERGKVFIQVSLAGETDTHVMLRFAITDTGIGIPADRVNRLFNSMFQADGPTRPTQGGSGLGLAISKYLAQMMGGEIGVNSHEGKGSTFWFTAVLEKQLEGEDRLHALSPDIPRNRHL